MIISSFRAWLVEHRSRLAERLTTLIEDVRIIRKLWEEIQYHYPNSELVRFPFALFDVAKWEWEHKLLHRLFWSVAGHANRVAEGFASLGIVEHAPLVAMMNDQNARLTQTALSFTRLLNDHEALPIQHQERIRKHGLPKPQRAVPAQVQGPQLPTSTPGRLSRYA